MTNVMARTARVGCNQRVATRGAVKVVVTGGGALLGQGLIRSLQRSPLDAEVIVVDPSPLSPGLYWVENRYLVPMASDPAYVEAIESVLATERPDALLVGTDVELGLLASNRHPLEQRYGTRVVVAEPQVIEIANDKLLTATFLRDKGFNPPESREPHQAQELVELFGFPLIVKPRIGARSVGLSLVRTQEELDLALGYSPGMVVQEYVGDAGAEYTAGTLTFDGACRASIVMRRDLRDGNTWRAFLEEDPGLTEQVRGMAEALSAFGPANFQFRLENGQVRVFEINARFSGTTPLRALLGFDEVDMTLRHLLFDEPIHQPKLRDLVILRHMSETVVPASELLP